MAPSACNAQPWHLIVVDDPELKNKVADATSTRVLGINHFTKQAPVHILLVEEKVNLMSGVGGWIKNKDYAQIDLGIAAAYAVLAAHAEGLGSCILGWFDEGKIKSCSLFRNQNEFGSISLSVTVLNLFVKRRENP